MIFLEYFVIMCMLLNTSWFRDVSAHHDDILCGFPGIPADGHINIRKDSYQPKEKVSFTCSDGYERIGPPTNECTDLGTWRNELPLCMQNVAYNRPAEQSTTENDFYASLAVDGNKISCAETKMNYNSWSVQLDKEYTIESVDLKATIATPNNRFNLSVEVLKSSKPTSFQRCSSLLSPQRGETTLETKVKCSTGNMNIDGNIIRIVDVRFHKGKLRLCEVKVFVKQEYKCGNPDFQPNCKVSVVENGQNRTAKYSAREGYQLAKGSQNRPCIKGKWLGFAPLCVETNPGQNRNSSSGKNNGDSMILGIAIGVTAASISTVIVIVVIVVIMRKLYRKTPTQTATLNRDHEGVFLHGNNSSCGSRSPTVPTNYADPWDDPINHTYDYINPETFQTNKLQREASLKLAKPSIDGTGYITSSHRNNNRDMDKTARESLLESGVPMRNRYTDRRQLPEPKLSIPQSDNRANSFNELEVDAYNYSDTEDQSRM